MTDLIINGRYRMEHKIGQGAFGRVYAGTDLKLGQEVAIKLEVAEPYTEPCLERDRVMYTILHRWPGVPKVHWCGVEGDYAVIVLDALGPNLETLLEYCGGTFSLKTVLLIAKQALRRLQRVHSTWNVHCDIKPENLVMGSGKQGTTLYLIDFGNSVGRRNPDVRHSTEPNGTPLFASIDQNRGLETSWANDVECLGYTLLYMIRGTLPWKDIDVPPGSDAGQLMLMADMKESLSPEALCEGLPAEFAQFIGYARALDYKVRPDYRRLERWIDAMFRAGGFSHDNVFDWTEKRFREVREEWEAQL